MIFTPSYAPRVGGVETVTLRLASELTRQGYSVLVVTQRYPRSLPSYEIVDGIAVRRLVLPTWNAAAWRYPVGVLKQSVGSLLAPLALLQTYLLVRRFRPGVVNVHYPSGPARYILAVAWVLRLPLVLSFHGSDVPGTPYGSASPRLIQRMCRRVGAVTACSADLLERLMPYLPPGLPGRAIVAHAGVDACLPRADVPEDEEYDVVAIARLVEKKGIETLLRAIGVLAQRGVPVRLAIAGDGPLRGRLEALAIELGVSDRIRFLGNVGHDRAVDLLKRASIVVVPSLWEAFGVVCLEAMAAGTPVVASRTGGILEILGGGETGLLVPPGDAPSLADALQRLLADTDLRAALGNQGRLRAATFTWERAADKYLEAYVLALGTTDGRSVPLREGSSG